MLAIAPALWAFRGMAQSVLLASAVTAAETSSATTTALPGSAASFTVPAAFPTSVFSSYYGEKPDPAPVVILGMAD